MTQGRSLSGNERNCCYLNTQGIEFANASFVSGFDFPSDSRGLALVDWDHDGDLDVWQSNRTSPRLRFLRNNTVSPETVDVSNKPSTNRWISLKLTGTVCNRDAIGARVTIELDGVAKPLVRTVRAGEGYLAQSSKRLLIGLGAEARITHVSVRWPDGSIDTFRGIDANRHYTLVQGEAEAKAWTRPRSPAGIVHLARPNLPEPQISTRRIVPHRRLPIPDLPFVGADGSQHTATVSSPTLVVIWASWCAPCLAELQELSQHQDQLREHDLSIVAISVDDLPGDGVTSAASGNSSQPFVILERLGIPGQHGIATDATKTKLDLLQRSLLSRQRDFSIPSSLLLDEQGRLAAVYQGRVSWEQVIADAAMIRQTASDSRDRAVPFPGRWFVGEIPPDVLSIAGKLATANLPHDSLAYLDRHVLPQVESEHSAGSVWPPAQIAGAYLDVGVQLGKVGAKTEAEQAIRTSIRLAPQQLPAYAALANLLESAQRYRDALATYEAMLAVRPNNPLALNNMAWIYVSASDPSVRDPGRGVELAERACEITQHGVVAMLDTLASAYVANNDLAKAKQTLDRAIEQARRQGNARSVSQLEAKRAQL